MALSNVINQKTSTDIQKLLEGSTPPNSQIWFFGDRHYLNNTEIANSFPSLDELKSHGITSIKIAIEAIPYREHSSTSFDLLSEYDFENTIFPVLIRTMPNNQLNLFNLFKSEEIVRAPNIHAILQKIKMYSKDIPVTFNGIE